MPSREIAKQIGGQGGDDVLALNGNQGTLCDDVRLFLDDPTREPGPTSSSTDGDHGRIETRTATVSTDLEWLPKDHQWPGLAAIGKVTRRRESKTKTSIETGLYLLSTPLTAARLNDVAGVESIPYVTGQQRSDMRNPGTAGVKGKDERPGGSSRAAKIVNRGNGYE